MPEPVTSSPSQPVPPAEQTSAASPDVATGAVEVGPVRRALTEAVTGRLPDPRPRTLATQEIRLALSFTGGVSLAVWMGGVARELNLMVQASERRRTTDEPPDATTPDENRVRRGYRRLLDLVDAEVAIDVLAGTSAGGINAALLGLANARGIDLGPLRDIWLTAGDFGKLMRDPAEQAPPSLLKGDGQMLAALNDGIKRLIATRPVTRAPLETDVFITTTLLSPETSRFTDDYGTEIADADHHGMFHFTTEDLTRDQAVAELALAARSSASFPGAFEPSFVPFGKGTAADAGHPDMAMFTNATRSHWAADGGLLANRPIAPLLQRVFDRPADREVRRALLYVVPSTESPSRPDDDVQTKPLGLAAALTRDLGAALTQSIAADLAAIKEHNDRVRSAADTALRMVSLGNRLGKGRRLTDEAAWQDYTARQGDWLVAPLVAEVCRQLTTLAQSLPPRWADALGEKRDVALRSAARDAVTKDWPTTPPPPADAIAAAVSLGRPAYDSAKATLLRLLRLGRVLATTIEDRNALAALGRLATRPMSDAGRSPLRTMVEEGLLAAVRKAADDGSDLTSVVTTLASDYVGAQVDEAQLTGAWTSLAQTYRAAVRMLPELVAAAPATTPDEPRRLDGVSVRQRRAVAAAELSEYLDFFGDGNDQETVARFLDLHVAVRSVLPVLTEVAQPVELIQVSADTRSLLAPNHSSALTKLTGMQVHHFGAFYKPSWRANDWMWGRLDGCGWLVHVLLDPRRILGVMENDGVPPGSRADAFLTQLGMAVEDVVPPERRADLAFLDQDEVSVPVSLPELAMWVASVLQRHIAADELPVVAALVGHGQEGRKNRKQDEQRDLGYQGTPSTEGVSWLAQAGRCNWPAATLAEVARLLDTCPVPAETIAQEAKSGSPLFIRTATQAAAVATAAGTAIGATPTSLKPTFAAARTVTRTAYVAANRARGQRRLLALIGVGLLVAGVLALLTAIPFFGLTGLVAFASGAVVLAFAVGPKTMDALRIVLALALVLLAAAPWLPWLDKRVFQWLAKGVTQMEKTPWIWPVLLFLVLLPPASAVGNLLKRRRPRAAVSGGSGTAPETPDDGPTGAVVPTPRRPRAGRPGAGAPGAPVGG